MKASLLLAALSPGLFAWNVVAQATASTPIVTGLTAIQTLDCYKSVGNLTKVDEYDFASDGWCQQVCANISMPIMAMTAGSTCYCGNTVPGKDQIVAGSNCDSPCNGFNLTMCGGLGYWRVYTDGLTAQIYLAPNSTTSSSNGATSAVVTKTAETVIVTQSSSSNAGPNKVGIAVGVVVGLVVLGSTMGGVIFILRQKKRQAIEDEHRRLEAAAAAAAAEKSDAASTRTDQRLDPSNIFSHRRESIGSIADEMDFSRRILQVRNPDRYSSTPTPTNG